MQEKKTNGPANEVASPQANQDSRGQAFSFYRPQRFTEIISGKTLSQLRDDYRSRIFEEYLPFWNKGGVDEEFGGFMCELKSDGSVQHEEKYIWYQGRGIWVYSYIYNNFGKDRQFLDIASKARDFIMKYMYVAQGQWRESVDRQGKPITCTVGQSSEDDIYGALFSAAGLVELFKATGNVTDLEIAKESIWSSIKRYEDPGYKGVKVPGMDERGLRTQGHSFIIIWILTNLLSFDQDAELEKVQSEHVDHIMNHFWNSEFGITNEVLFHDYTRIPKYEGVMFSGHALEALWMVLHEAVRKNDNHLFQTAKARIRRLIEMSWDYVFGGLCSGDYHVFGREGICPGPTYELKVMWAQAELLIATMTLFELTGETWAKEWYERVREYCLRNMANTPGGVWREAVDRFGKDKQRPILSIFRKDNFHQIRYQLMNLLSLERMIKNSK